MLSFHRITNSKVANFINYTFRCLCNVSNYEFSNRAIVDKIRISCTAGRGGNGAVSYIKHKAHHLIGPGWPCGGSGGKGGDILLHCTDQFTSLDHLRKSVTAPNGKKGKKETPGEPGKDIILEIPIGSLVSIVESNELKQELKLLKDFTIRDERILACRGGSGGKGNVVSNPHECGSGQEGETVLLQVELKTLADVGLVGKPNAGKSTLLNALTRARSQVASYPFTTLRPFVGEIPFGNDFRASIADIPGLIEDAHQNRGLGDQFLKHIERTSMLIYVVDCSSDSPYDDFIMLRKELSLYSPSLSRKKSIIVANKCDVDTMETLKKVDVLYSRISQEENDVEVVALSAKYGDGLKRLVSMIKANVEELRGHS